MRVERGKRLVSDEDRDRAIGLVPTLAVVADRLEVYAELLNKWQSRINLVGRSTLHDLWTRHFADSAQLAGIVPLAGCWADLGSGAGFPGLVLALMQDRSASEMHLIESDARKAAFLREVSRETGAGAVVHKARCEDILAEIDPSVIASRAMANLETLWTLSAPLVEKGALALFMKGRDVASELTAASIPSSYSVTLFPSKIDAASSIVRIQSGHTVPTGD